MKVRFVASAAAAVLLVSVLAGCSATTAPAVKPASASSAAASAGAGAGAKGSVKTGVPATSGPATVANDSQTSSEAVDQAISSMDDGSASTADTTDDTDSAGQ